MPFIVLAHLSLMVLLTVNQYLHSTPELSRPSWIFVCVCFSCKDKFWGPVPDSTWVGVMPLQKRSHRSCFALGCIQSDSGAMSSACRMAVTLSAAPSLEMHQLHTVVWVMTSWVRSQKNGMTTCCQCDRLSTLSSFLPIFPALV